MHTYLRTTMGRGHEFRKPVRLWHCIRIQEGYPLISIQDIECPVVTSCETNVLSKFNQLDLGKFILYPLG